MMKTVAAMIGYRNHPIMSTPTESLSAVHFEESFIEHVGDAAEHTTSVFVVESSCLTVGSVNNAVRLRAAHF